MEQCEAHSMRNGNGQDNQQQITVKKMKKDVSLESVKPGIKLLSISYSSLCKMLNITSISKL